MGRVRAVPEPAPCERILQLVCEVDRSGREERRAVVDPAARALVEAELTQEDVFRPELQWNAHNDLVHVVNEVRQALPERVAEHDVLDEELALRVDAVDGVLGDGLERDVHGVEDMPVQPQAAEVVVFLNEGIQRVGRGGHLDVVHGLVPNEIAHLELRMPLSGLDGHGGVDVHGREAPAITAVVDIPTLRTFQPSALVVCSLARRGPVIASDVRAVHGDATVARQRLAVPPSAA
mmetsp:Transcript_148636/g.477246  ORF Transcript_148636/g.477246 Transcript_148636/m.477246 type:complete len:235 (+) Transcript_148636:1322-2026(+)